MAPRFSGQYGQANWEGEGARGMHAHFSPFFFHFHAVFDKKTSKIIGPGSATGYNDSIYTR